MGEGSLWAGGEENRIGCPPWVYKRTLRNDKAGTNVGGKVIHSRFTRKLRKDEGKSKSSKIGERVTGWTESLPLC